MPVIVLTTVIHAPIEVCFDLARSIDFHLHSVSHTNENAVAGVVTGLIDLGEEVTWQARHFGLWLSLTSQITAFDRPAYFRDSMKCGPFKRFDHDHFFECENGITKMRDRFDYDSPLGLLGRCADSIFLERYMTKMLLRRNDELKKVAETNPARFLPAP